VGFGLAIVRVSLQEKSLEFDFFGSDVFLIENVVVFTTLGTNQPSNLGLLIFTAASIYMLRGTLPKTLGLILVGIYAFFFLSVTFIAIVKI
jgi:hypothetical protein